MAVFIASCSSSYLSVEDRVENIDVLAKQEGFQQHVIATDSFNVFSLLSASKEKNDKILDVYIEGDGFAWVSRRQVSQNPTPINPLAFHLAVAGKGATAYLARPCQYVNSSKCTKSYWTGKRFSSEVVIASGQAIDRLKELSGTSRIRLFGYSGGGAVAALLASERDDVDLLVTIAGNLAPDYWAKYHGFSLLVGSLSPADYAQRLQGVKQIHFVGANDTNIVPEVSASYRASFEHQKNITVVLVSGADHSCCWKKLWPQLLQQVNAF